MNFDVITFGSAVTDIFVDTELSEKNNFLYYHVGSKILIKDLKFDIGGGGTNTAVAFARLGFKTGCICKLGNDNNGRDILTLLKKEKIVFLGSIAKEKTGCSIILDSKEKDRTILTFKGPNNKIKLDEIPRIRTKWLYLSSLMGESFETQKKLAHKLIKNRTKIAFNPSSYLIEYKELLPLLKITSILILNKEEAGMLCKKYNKKNDIVSLHELGAKIIVITNKDKIITCYDGNKKYFIKPHKMRVVERTGAGDAFASGFVAAFMVNKPIQKCLELGLKESESVLLYFGAKNKLLRMKLKRND
jgi:ribokinase